MTIGSLYNASNVVVGQAATYFAPANTALPPLTGWNAADPFDPLFFITPAGWVQTGATDQGWSLSVDKSTQTINIEEQSTPVATTITNQTVKISAALSEDITRTLALTLNATSATVAVAPTTPGYDLITLTDTPIYYAAAMVTVNDKGFGRLVYAPKWSSLSNVSVAFRRASDKRQYTAELTTVCATNLIQIYNFNAGRTA